MEKNASQHTQTSSRVPLTHIYLSIKQKVQLYLRYFNNFFKKINEVHPSKAQIHFLDIIITIRSTGKNINSTMQKRNRPVILYLPKIRAL